MTAPHTEQLRHTFKTDGCVPSPLRRRRPTPATSKESLSRGALVQPLYRRTDHKHASPQHPPPGTTTTPPCRRQSAHACARYNAVPSGTARWLAAAPAEPQHSHASPTPVTRSASTTSTARVSSKHARVSRKPGGAHGNSGESCLNAGQPPSSHDPQNSRGWYSSRGSYIGKSPFTFTNPRRTPPIFFGGGGRGRKLLRISGGKNAFRSTSERDKAGTRTHTAARVSPVPTRKAATRRCLSSLSTGALHVKHTSKSNPK